MSTPEPPRITLRDGDFHINMNGASWYVTVIVPVETVRLHVRTLYLRLLCMPQHGHCFISLFQVLDRTNDVMEVNQTSDTNNGSAGAYNAPVKLVRRDWDQPPLVRIHAIAIATCNLYHAHTLLHCAFRSGLSQRTHENSWKLTKNTPVDNRSYDEAVP